MALEGLHHITAITADAPANVDFYASRLGLRLVKKTVNFDAPDVYHLYFGDETGTPGSILTFFAFPGGRVGRRRAARDLRLRRAAAGARPAGRRDHPPRRVVGGRRRRAAGRARACGPGGRAADAHHRPPVLPLGLLPRAQWRALRA